MSSIPPPPAPYDASPPTPAPRPSNKLGLIAFLVVVVGVVAASILAFIGGMQSGGLVQFADTANGTTQIDPSNLPDSGRQMAMTGGLLTGAGFLVYVVLGLWGFIQGIVAVAKKRGRGWGIAAIVLAVLGVVAVVVFLGIGAAAGAAPYL